MKLLILFGLLSGGFVSFNSRLSPPIVSDYKTVSFHNMGSSDSAQYTLRSKKEKATYLRKYQYEYTGPQSLQHGPAVYLSLRKNSTFRKRHWFNGRIYLSAGYYHYKNKDTLVLVSDFKQSKKFERQFDMRHPRSWLFQNMLTFYEQEFLIRNDTLYPIKYTNTDNQFPPQPVVF